MSYSSEALRGKTETIILAILKDGDSYGYEILRTILERSRGLIEIRDATIYTAFKRMERDGLIETYWGDEIEGGARRKYYSITPQGREFYNQRVEEWKQINAVLSDLIGGKK